MSEEKPKIPCPCCDGKEIIKDGEGRSSICFRCGGTGIFEEKITTMTAGEIIDELSKHPRDAPVYLRPYDDEFTQYDDVEYLEFHDHYAGFWVVG